MGWEKMIDKIVEKKEFVKTLRENNFLNTADKYLEMIGALKLYFLEQRKQAQLEILDEVLKHQCEMYDAYRHQVVKVEDIEAIKGSLK